MKKILAVLLSAMIVSSCAAFSVSAYQSPKVAGDSDSDSDSSDDDGNGGRTKPGSDTDSSSKSSSSTSSTSPKTGAPVSYGVLMAAAALAFGSVAFASKKKIEE